MKIEFENSYKKKVFVLLPLIGIDIPERYFLVYFICFGFKVSFNKKIEDSDGGEAKKKKKR